MRAHSILIATCHRENLLARALSSISNQHQKPDRVVVVDDSPQADLQAIRALGRQQGLHLEVLANRRTKGASGAWNTGLDHIARACGDPSCHYVSILDDDDWWEPDYLTLVSEAFKADSDIEVVAGTLSRRDKGSPQDRLIFAPEMMSAHDFLVGNPGIQGSNLSARLSTLLEAGMFDEALRSCTDRDLCIRLADLGAGYQTVPKAIAHHDCIHGLARLSDVGADAKNLGLDVFYAKWHRRMTPDQNVKFLQRAQRLFDWAPQSVEPTCTPTAPPTVKVSKQAEPLQLIVGVIIDGSKPWRSLPLLDGLATLSTHSLVSSIDVVLLENGAVKGFAKVINHAESNGLSVWPIRLAHQSSVMHELPLREQDITRQKPIAIARTLLQRFVYEVSQARNHAPAWILDDDFRLLNNHDKLVAAMVACRDEGIDVVLGGNSGAAPVPTSSLLRTQLVDLVHLLISAAKAKPEDIFPDADAANSTWLQNRRDAHYDLSRRETDRLETPFLPTIADHTLGEGITQILRAAERIFAGEPIIRPVADTPVCHPKDAQTSCWRGGNTFVTDTALLRDIPNMSPRVEGRPTRRSDMIWAANVLYRYGKQVKAFRLPMYHDRSAERTDDDDTLRLVDDILGYGFFSAYEEVMRNRDQPSAPLTDQERRRTHNLTRKYTIERLSAYRLSFWRIKGLKRTLDNLLAATPWWLRDADHDTHAAFERFLNQLSSSVKLTHLHNVEHRVTIGLERADFERFLFDMDQIHPDAPAHQCDGISDWVQTGRYECARKLLAQKLGRDDAVLLGMGAEGIVMRTGERVVKVFDRWTIAQRRTTSPLLMELHRRPAFDALPNILATHDWPEVFAVEYEFVESQPYTGGNGPALVKMLKALQQTGWVHSNINPKNLRVTAHGLQLIDVGRSVDHHTPLGEELMIRRAFLSWRFANRKDLMSLMRASLKTEHLPELTGWRALFEAVVSPQSKNRLDQLIIDRLEAFAPMTVLDYGCGKPRDVAKWLGDRQVSVFDIEPALRGRWLQSAPKVRFWDEHCLAQSLANAQTFDVIVCSLVLCTVDDETMATILANLRRLANAGGHVIVAVCDPAALHTSQTVDQTRHGTTKLDPALPARYLKNVNGSPVIREEYHRSVEAYRRAFAKAGLRVVEERPVEGCDAERLERAPEFLVFELAPLPTLTVRTSLLIKLCAMEAETALHQVRHLERQLGRPRAFDEIVLLIDSHEGPFPRAHSSADLSGLHRAAARLKAEGIVDCVLEGFNDGAATAKAARRWTGVEAHHAHCANGQPATAILAAFEACKGDYILHADADVLIARPDPGFDHIADSVRLLEDAPDVVTLALAVRNDTDMRPRSGSAMVPFRVEAMCGWVSKKRLVSLRPLSGGADEGRLNLPWHRMVDISIRKGLGKSLRRGSNTLWWTALDNLRKAKPENIELLMGRVESGFAPPLQASRSLLAGTMSDWCGPKRSEPIVVVICGRNVSPGKVDRCFASLRTQSYQAWGAIVIDDESDEPCREAVRRECATLGHRVTLVHRYQRAGLMANTFMAIRELIASKGTIVVLLDMDDALADTEALSVVNAAYRDGADLTIGSMLRTDKNVAYPVDFTNPRGNRGGNVWQHMRTFRKSLFDRIEPSDLKISGDWVDLANDWAYMLPLVELAERPYWLRQQLYLHEPSTSRPLEERTEREATISQIVAKPSYRKVRTLQPQITVLCYHRILDCVTESGPESLFYQQAMAVTTSTLRAQLADALRTYEPVSIADLLAAQRGERTLPERALLVTVDGGYKDFSSNGLPIMLSAGIEPLLFSRLPATDGLPSWAPLDLLYIARGLAGRDTPFPDPNFRARLLKLPIGQQLAEVEKIIGVPAANLTDSRQTLYLSETELRALPGVSLGCHGVENVRWTNLTNDHLDKVLSRSVTWLQSMDATSLVAAYPDGAVDHRVATRMAYWGFDAAFTIRTPNNIHAPNLTWSRIVMTDDPHQLSRRLPHQRQGLA